MKLHSNNYILRLTDQQVSSLKILKSKGVIPSKFIRQAIKDKLQREWKNIKNNDKNKCPF